MSNKNLKHKPLMETILEIKWKVLSQNPLEKTNPFMIPFQQMGTQIPPISGIVDPSYKILLGKMYDKLAGKSGEYPFYEQLPQSMMPDEIAGFMVQHRFRSSENEWPLIQIGPGIITVNETSEYTWNDFRRRVISAVNTLFEVHPKSNEIIIENIMIRYINAINFDYKQNDLIQFLNDKMHFNIEFPPGLLNNEYVSTHPTHFQWQTSFECLKPAGIIGLNLGTGHKEQQQALVLELVFNSVNEKAPKTLSEIELWLDASHELLEGWFFKLIEGDLERGFNGE